MFQFPGSEDLLTLAMVILGHGALYVAFQLVF